MQRRAVVFGAPLLASSFALAPAAFASDTQDAVNGAATTIEHLKSDKEFGPAQDVLRKARAVLIVPSLFKAGFFFGGQGGFGVLLARSGNNWSYPAFFTLGSASFGLQIGAQLSEFVMFIMSSRALEALMHNRVQLGANAGLAVATLGATAGGATTTNLRADIVVWSSSTGAYAGISLEGTVIQPRTSYDREYYGRALTTRDIIFRHEGSNPGANGLREALTAIA
jgi:lipid-binding SYLF domain-containing protein